MSDCFYWLLFQGLLVGGRALNAALIGATKGGAMARCIMSRR
ncbi:MAG: hypothetical protein VYE54_10560 [Pseudomonadota bacterium]|nr:hypothetical protein [Pseudomonadota bacterium]